MARPKKSPLSLLRRYTDLTATIDLLSRKRLVLLDPTFWDDRNDSYFIEKYKQQIGAKSVFALCMSQSNETYHHWRVFCGHSNGVCIQFLKKELLGHIGAAGGIRSGRVNYMTLGEIERKQPAPPEWPFIKRKAFHDEDEFRIIYQSMDVEEPRPVHEVEIPLSIIHSIRLNPWLPRPLFPATREVLTRIPDCAHIKIDQSDLINNERFKKNVDKVVRDRQKPGGQAAISAGTE